MKHLLNAFLLMLTIPWVANALEAQEPTSLCDRFLGSAQEACVKKITEMKPDWYLASVCNLQFDDKIFFDCLSLGAKHSFSPSALEACTAPDLSDADRMICIEKAHSSLADSFQADKVSRKPASLPVKRKHHK
jgi:hypothetical protein